MSNFETFGFDEFEKALEEDALKLEAECPICNNVLVLDLSLEERKIVCPHCKNEIEY